MRTSHPACLPGDSYVPAYWFAPKPKGRFTTRLNWYIGRWRGLGLEARQLAMALRLSNKAMSVTVAASEDVAPGLATALRLDAQGVRLGLPELMAANPAVLCVERCPRRTTVRMLVRPPLHLVEELVDLPPSRRKDKWYCPAAVRRAVLRRDGTVCRYCGLDVAGRVTLDHVTPKSRGGLDVPSNIVVACMDCNVRKGGRLPEQAGMVLLPIGGAP